MGEFKNRIICGDCIEVLRGIDKPFADLIFADPPFNIGYKYDTYKDNKKKEHYLDWTLEWMAECRRVLKPYGSIYIAIGDEYAANVKVIADELGLYMRNWIIWHYTFGQQTKNKFARSHTHIFYFSKDKKHFTFNDYSVRVPSERQLMYNDRRANPSGKIPNDVWDGFSRVCGTFKERRCWHPCQMPVNLLKRIIAVSSNMGDCIFDPFCGSGTTSSAAFELGRNYFTIDISSEYVENARERLAQVRSNNKSSLFGRQLEDSELKRLLVEFGRDPVEILGNRNLLKLFTNQFCLRMNGEKVYEVDELVSALERLNT